MEAVKESQSTKKGFFSRLRRSKTGNVATDANKAESDPAAMTTDEGGQPSQPTGTQSQSATVTREGLPIISSNADGFKPSEVRQNNKRVKKGVTMERKSVILEKAPAARDAAFGGPPRYDWIDIVSYLHLALELVVVPLFHDTCRLDGIGNHDRSKKFTRDRVNYGYCDPMVMHTL